VLFTLVGVMPLCGQARLGVPSYQDPGTPAWVGWERPGPQAIGIMIVNLDNGDDETYYPGVEQAIRETRKRGIFVLGYTYTGYGQRDPKVVQRKVDAVYTNYLVDGIFFDEVPTNCDGRNPYLPTQFLYYQQLTNYVREKAGARITVLNPGTYSSDDCWMGITNILMNWEDQGLDSYRDDYVDYAWVHKYPPDRFWHIVYGMSADQLTTALTLAKQRNAGWLYFTNEAGDNPYASSPRYWSEEAAAVKQQAVQAPFATAWPNSQMADGSRALGRVSVRWSSAGGSQWQVFLDTDQNSKTGYHGGGLAVGGEYLLQCDSGHAQLFRYTGSGIDWSWAAVPANAKFDSLEGPVLTASFDTSGLAGTKNLNYQIRAFDVSGQTLGDSYVLTLGVTNTGMVFDILNHRQ
jgi:Spherulation-specific family 4